MDHSMRILMKTSINSLNPSLHTLSKIDFLPFMYGISTATFEHFPANLTKIVLERFISNSLFIFQCLHNILCQYRAIKGITANKLVLTRSKHTMGSDKCSSIAFSDVFSWQCSNCIHWVGPILFRKFSMCYVWFESP